MIMIKVHSSAKAALCMKWPSSLHPSSFQTFFLDKTPCGAQYAEICNSEYDAVTDSSLTLYTSLS